MRAVRLFPALLTPSRTALIRDFLNTFAMKRRTGPYGSYNNILSVIVKQEGYNLDFFCGLLIHNYLSLAATLVCHPFLLFIFLIAFKLSGLVKGQKISLQSSYLKK